MPYILSDKTAQKLNDVLDRNAGGGGGSPGFNTTGSPTNYNFNFTQGFYAVICGQASDSDAFSWKEAEYQGSGNFVIMDGGRSGDKAYDINNNPVDTGTVVRLYSTPVDDDYIFDTQSFALKPVSCDVTSNGSDTSDTSDSSDTSDTGGSDGSDGNPQCPFTGEICVPTNIRFDVLTCSLTYDQICYRFHNGILFGDC